MPTFGKYMSVEFIYRYWIYPANYWRIYVSLEGFFRWAQLSRAQLSAPKNWTVRPRTVRGPVVRGPTVWGPTVRGPIRLEPWTVSVTGLFCLLISFFFLGPSPFLPIPPKIPLKLVGLMFLGFGTGSVLVASNSCALNAALQMPAYPEDIKTYSLVSSLWTAAFAIRSFLGTSLAGLLFDNIGWEWSCTAVQGLISLTLVLSLSWQDKTIKSLPREDQSRRQEKDEGAQTWRRTNKDSWRLTKSLFFDCLLQQIVSCGRSGCKLCIMW